MDGAVAEDSIHEGWADSLDGSGWGLMETELLLYYKERMLSGQNLEEGVVVLWDVSW